MAVTASLVGTFDLFHVGHVEAIRRARTHCDWLVVHVVDDDLADTWTGQRPWISYAERRELIGAVRGVDEVREFRIGDPFSGSSLVLATDECPVGEVAPERSVSVLAITSITASHLLRDALKPRSRVA